MAHIAFLERRKRTYDDVLQRRRRAPGCTSPERKRRRACRKRSFSEVSRGRERSPGFPSPERKRSRICRKRPHSEDSRSREVRCPDRKRSRTGSEVTKARIWIIGSGYVHRGERAARRMFGENLGLPDAKVDWFGKGGMLWRELLPRFYTELATQSPPDILVVHAGGDGLGPAPAQDLAGEMTADLLRLRKRVPAMKIAFSCVDEGRPWRCGSPGRTDCDRRFVNKLVGDAVGGFGGEVIEHAHLRYFNPRLFLPDGVHLTEEGNGVFLGSIRGALQRMLPRPR